MAERWFTPPDIIDRARRTMGGIDLDPASEALANKVVRARQFYSSDGEAMPWGTPECPSRVWVNPPWQARKAVLFARKLGAEMHCRHVAQAIFCIGARSVTDMWCHDTLFSDLISPGALVWFSRGRPCDIDAETARPGMAHPQGTMLVYYGPRGDAFRAEFATLGKIFTGAERDDIQLNIESLMLHDRKVIRDLFRSMYSGRAKIR